MEPKPTLPTLPFECLMQIVVNLNLQETLVFRTLSRQLKTAVDKHFRLVDTLPVILSCPNSRSNDPKLKQFVLRYPNPNFGLQFDEVAFGPPSLCWTLFDDERILDKIKHFRRKDFMIVPNTLTAFDGFIEFIIKYMPKVTKLGLIIDYESYEYPNNYNHVWDHIRKILDIYREQLKVVLIDKTLRSAYKKEEVWMNKVSMPCIADFNIPKSFVKYINNLHHLEELYFFSKKRSVLNFNSRWFIVSMLRKLRVFHLNGTCLENILFQYKDNERPRVLTFDNVEEMYCSVWRINWTFESVNYPELKFPKLKKLIVDSDSFKAFPDELRMPNLVEIHFNCWVSIDPIMNSRFNNFPKLERISCYGLQTKKNPRDANRSIVPANPVNRTIKHIVIENLPNDNLKSNSVDRIPIENFLYEAKSSLRYFPSLRTVTIREPYMKLTVEELKDL